MDISSRYSEILAFLEQGGPAIWAIAALSILTLALILWKLWRLALMGAWATGATNAALTQWQLGHCTQARGALAGRRAVRAVVAHAAMTAQPDPRYTDQTLREEIQRVAKAQLERARSGLRALELISTIAPLLGLLGTVLGMIAAFQTLQEAGSRADPAVLAGGIWEALLTTAAGMAVAIPASAALTWFESIAERAQTDMEDAITRILTHPAPDAAQRVQHAAE